ncbi:molybdate ABC transporter substrate-binding protein [Arenibacter sp. GZD96]|uniref:molybdate ABC transporter substrate-binding protein n=1 Tax=Aurantibrevibacter litoralis TaxID=3106030 RepID=UPI002B00225D|nr:molybdate ABC transporter substrate-binding protein [Arenibacter sp. GZD-96]MEA1786196.1 molybdate ABC transporter substrate-binding protein [Arenibacter sp. GZD-96]
MKRKIGLFVFATVFLFSGWIVSAQEKVVIAAASDLKFALDSVISVYQKVEPTSTVQVIYGSSGKFFEQIQHGAPFDIYFSADKSYPQKLQQDGFTASEVKIYGIGRIVIWSKKIDPNKDKMNSFLNPEIKKIAIANPEHAPYGARAKESMEFYTLYERVKSKFVFGENIAQTAQFVQLGAADIGIVALSLALSPTLKKSGGMYYLIPETSHLPLEQGYVILKPGKDKPLAHHFYDFVASQMAIAILTHFGFTQLGNE